MKVVMELLDKCVEENAHNALHQIEHEERYSALAGHYENIKNGIVEINEKCLNRRRFLTS